MKDPETNENARCRNSNLNEDLGKIDYIQRQDGHADVERNAAAHQ
jgi:hypothetical protein